MDSSYGPPAASIRQTLSSKAVPSSTSLMSAVSSSEHERTVAVTARAAANLLNNILNIFI